jgi:hypothetical protein
MNRRALKRLALLGTLLFGLTEEAEAAKPLLVMKCSEPKGATITLQGGRIQQDNDAISSQSYTLVIYQSDKGGFGRATVIAEGKNSMNEQGNYRAYGSQDSIVVDVTILHDEAAWTYSLFPKEHVLFIHSTKVGVDGKPTAQLFVATCS